MDSSIVEKIVHEIEGYAPKDESEHVGRVTSVGDGVVAIDGLSNAVMSEIIMFEEGKGNHSKHRWKYRSQLYGLILNLEEDGIRATILGD